MNKLPKKHFNGWFRLPNNGLSTHWWLVLYIILLTRWITYLGRLYSLTGSVVGHISIAPGFKRRPDYVRSVFHLSLRLVIFGGRSAHLAYLLHKIGRKTATFWITYLAMLLITLAMNVKCENAFYLSAINWMDWAVSKCDIADPRSRNKHSLVTAAKSEYTHTLGS